MAKSFHQLSQRSQGVVFGLLCVVTVGAGWQVLVGPEREQLATRESHLSDLQAQLTGAQAVDKKDPQDVLRNLHDLASDSSLDIATFTPKAIATKSQYSEWPIELGLEGSYHDLGRFFDRVASAPRLMSVSELHIKTKARPDAK